MSAAAVLPRARRTQSERVEAMQSRILDAAVGCLVESGYAGLTTNDVVRRAGISRGALAHHYPTKADLVVATTTHLLASREADAREQLAALTGRRLDVDRALDIFWSMFEGPSFVALLELGVAARTDPDLRGVVRDAPERIVALIMDVYTDLFPRQASLPYAEDAVRAIFALYTGLAFESMVDGDPDGQHARVRQLTTTALKAALKATIPPR